MDDVESLVFAEGTRSGWRFGVVEVGVVWIRIWIGARRIWIGMALVSRLRISILYGVHVHGVGRVVEVDGVGFVSCRDFLHKLGVEVEGVAGPQVCRVHDMVVGNLVGVCYVELGGKAFGDGLVDIIGEHYFIHSGSVMVFAHAI